MANQENQNKGEKEMKTLIECSTCGYPLLPEERSGLVEIDGKMCKPNTPLSDEEIVKVYDDMFNQIVGQNYRQRRTVLFARAIERAHGIGSEE
jgi:hypothetical protein